MSVECLKLTTQASIEGRREELVKTGRNVVVLQRKPVFNRVDDRSSIQAFSLDVTFSTVKRKSSSQDSYIQDAASYRIFQNFFCFEKFHVLSCHPASPFMLLPEILVAGGRDSARSRLPATLFSEGFFAFFQSDTIDQIPLG